MTTVFLTGATGFLGHYTLAALLRRADVRVRALLSPPLVASRARLASLLGEVGIDLLREVQSGRLEFAEGRLPDELPTTALSGMDVVVHTAASTKFRTDASNEPDRSNVDGTRALLDAASLAQAGRFVFVSTAYVGGISFDTVPEKPVTECSADANDYERAKWLAEQSVAEWATGDREAVIVRPSILIGDRETGRATNFGGIYVLARAVELLARVAEQDATIDRHQVPLRIMGSPRYPLNVVPVCWAAQHLAKIALTPAPAPAVVNLVNPAPPTIGDVKQWLEETFDVAGGRFTDNAWPWPNPSSCEEAFYAAGESVHAYFRRNVAFETTWLAAHGEKDALVTPASFKQCIDEARRLQWGRRNASSRPAPDTRQSQIDPVSYFETFMPERLPHSTVARIDSFTATVRYIITDALNAEWVCRYDAGRMVEMHRGPNTLHEDFGFRIGADAFDRIVTGRQTLQQTYFQSQAEIFGDTFMALKMVPIIDAFLREHPIQSTMAQVDAN